MATQVAEVFYDIAGSDAPVRFTAYDGSAAGPADADIKVDVVNPRAVTYLAGAPGSLGFARAYIMGDIALTGDIYDVLRMFTNLSISDMGLATKIGLARKLGPLAVKRAPRPAEEARMTGRLHSQARDAAGDRPPLQRVQPVLRAGARPVDGLHLRGLPDGRPRRSRRPSGPSTTSSRASSACSPACGCSTSAAAGAAWSATPPRSTASRRSASLFRRRRQSTRRSGSPMRVSRTSPRCGSSTTARWRRPASTRSARSASPSTSGGRRCRRTSRPSTRRSSRAGVSSTTASPGPGRPTRRSTRAASSTATSSLTVS